MAHVAISNVDAKGSSLHWVRKILASNWVLRGVSIAIALLLWELFAGYLYRNPLIPSLSQVLREAGRLISNGELLLHTTASLRRILLGFLLGTAVGAPMGLLMGSSRIARAILDPFVQFFRFVPSIAWLTPAVIFLGIGETSKVAIIFYTTLFVICINTAVGVASIPKNKLLAGAVLGASRLQIFLYVTIPSTMPYILTGMMLAMANSFTTVVSAEMVAADEGIGYLIFNSRLWMATDAIFVGIFLLGFLGMASDLIFRALIARFAKQYGSLE